MTRKHRKAADLYPPAGPSAMPLEDRPTCAWCGGRYVPGFWPWHAMWNHRHGPYTKGDWRDAMPPDVPGHADTARPAALMPGEPCPAPCVACDVLAEHQHVPGRERTLTEYREAMAAEDGNASFYAERLEYLRGEIRAERISWGELSELQDLAEYIRPDDVELLEWAGVPEFPE